jgi:hypothetical protein
MAIVLKPYLKQLIGMRMLDMTFLNPVKVAGIGQADVKIAYLKVLMNTYNMRIKNEQFYFNAV